MAHFHPHHAKLEAKLGYQFRDPNVLQLACIHRSYWNEHQHEVPNHNERLEFLGDAVLDLVVADLLYVQLPDLTEGELTRLRAQLVDAAACAKYCQQLELDPYLLLGKGELYHPQRGKESILADFFEAVIGALFVDGGLEAVLTYLTPHLQKEISERILQPQQNWKSLLQDFVQKNKDPTPVYHVLEERGPDHAPYFRIGVFVRDKKLAEGEGSSKKEAQTLAAQRALKYLQQEEEQA